jgi:TIR domain
MPVENPKYDVAISFLTQDEGTAAAIYQKLSEGLEVFFYPHNQEELAGTDGQESMRKPFYDESRLMVVLYRERWGKTPWTRVEETAIKEACLAHGWERLLFVILDQSSVPPTWLPRTHIRLNFQAYGLEQTVGAIKARVQEQGGQYLPLTPLKRAQMLKADEDFRRAKDRMKSSEGIEATLNSVHDLFTEIKRQCEQVTAQGHIQIRCGIEFRERSQLQSCGITDGQVSLSVNWNQLYTNSLDHSGLIVREFEGGFPPPGPYVVLNPPREVSKVTYSPDLSLARDYGWKEDGGNEFLSSTALAERCVIQFLDLVERHAAGGDQRIGNRSGAAVTRRRDWRGRLR